MNDTSRNAQDKTNTMNNAEPGTQDASSTAGAKNDTGAAASPTDAAAKGGEADLVTQLSEAQAKANEYLDIIDGEADRLSRLITNVLDFAKIEKGTKDYHMKPLDLNAIVQSTLHSLEYQIHSKGFIIHTQFEPSTLLIHGDTDAIGDAITNLITNAMKYSPAERKNITITTSHEDDQAIVSIQDEGYGIAHREIDHIFEAFYRIDDSVMKSAGGAGLGLSLVKHTMDAHHGRVEVRSEVGKGSIFALYFPLRPQ